jgi:hypothetical protein
MGFFSRRRRSEEPNQVEEDPMDPLVALKHAEEELAKTNWASDGNGHWQRISPEMKGKLSEGLEKARSSLESGNASTFGPGFGQDAPAAFAQPSRVEDPITKVERLVKLRDIGALTQDEFDEQKRKALEEG